MATRGQQSYRSSPEGEKEGEKILRKSKSANGQRQGDEEKEREVETCKMVVSGRSMSGQK